ncbi:MAG: Rrf2 family transcriptional regulator, partial [Elusimicrobia bacterium]|nr:Rrf2 family transcriptional regulator [Elusimicrobiota bacterium]
ETLAALQGIPKAFLSKILQQCARAGIIRAKKGAAGGVSLARAPRDITLLSIIEACEGSYARDACVFYATRRCTGPECEVYCALRQEEERLRRRLGRTTLADMARALSVHPDAAGVDAPSTGGMEWTRD